MFKNGIFVCSEETNLIELMNVFFQDNVLAAEKPPDAPSHEESSDPFPKKDDFLFDSFNQWKGPQDAAVSENDVFIFDESTAAPTASGFPEKTLDLEPAASESECMFSGERAGSGSKQARMYIICVCHHQECWCAFKKKRSTVNLWSSYI